MRRPRANRLSCARLVDIPPSFNEDYRRKSERPRVLRLIKRLNVIPLGPAGGRFNLVADVDGMDTLDRSMNNGVLTLLFHPRIYFERIKGMKLFVFFLIVFFF